MKKTILLTFSLLIISGSLFSKNGTFNYLDSDIKNPQTHFIKQDFSRLDRSNIKGSQELYRPYNSKIKTKIKYQDYGNPPLYQDNGALMPSLRSVKKEKPITKSKHYTPYYYMPGSPIRDRIKKYNQ